MLQRIVRLLGTVADPVIVVSQTDTLLGELPSTVVVTTDLHPGRGPLAGLEAGLSRLLDWGRPAFVTGCDSPLLQPAFVEIILEQLGDSEIAVPADGTRDYPLAAVYRPSVLAVVTELISRDRLRLRDLFDQVRTRKVPLEILRGGDPELQSLRNVNDPTEYLAVLQTLGYPAPQ